MSDHEQWRRELFLALSQAQVSRNKFPETFAQGWSREVHRRFKRVSSIKREAERLADVPGTACWVAPDGEDGLEFHLECPPLQYRRVIAVERHELEWLVAQSQIRTLLDIRSLEG